MTVAKRDRPKTHETAIPACFGAGAHRVRIVVWRGSGFQLKTCRNDENEPGAYARTIFEDSPQASRLHAIFFTSSQAAPVRKGSLQRSRKRV